MVLRNVAKTFSLEEQRQEINEIAVDLDAVNTTLTNLNTANWDTAYGWGDHAQAGYLTSYAETDPVFSASAASGITSTQVTNWDAAYGWGDHSTAGYLTAEADTLDSVTGRGNSTTNNVSFGNVESPQGTIKAGNNIGGVFTGSTITADGTLSIINRLAAGDLIYAGYFFNSIQNTFVVDSNANLALSGSLTAGGTATFSNTVEAQQTSNNALSAFKAVDTNGTRFNVTGAGVLSIYDNTLTENVTISSDGSATFAGILESSLLVNTNNTPTAGEGIEMFYDASATGGGAGGIQAYDRDGAALTRLKIRSSNWEILNNGSATFAGGNFAIGGTGAIGIDRGAGDNFIIEGKLNGSQTSLIKADGSATFSGTISDSMGPLRRLGIQGANSSFTLAADHAGKLVREASNGATITIPQNVFSAGDMISIFNVSTGDNTIAQGAGTTLYNTADGTTGDRTLGPKGVCTILCTSTNEFIISGSQVS